MKIYPYSQITGESLGKEKNARLDPLETEKQKKDVFLLPAFCTDIKPPSTKKNEAAVFENGAWSIVPDYRGTVYYTGKDTFTITELGDNIPLP